MIKLLVVLSVLLVPGLKAHTQPMVPLPDGRIVGGTDADIRKFPHQISMRYKGKHRCGGSVLSSNIIVSAAHCLVGEIDIAQLNIVAGSSNLTEKGWELPVSKFIVHEKYNAYNDFDVAILVLKGNFTFSEFIQPIALAKSRPAAGTKVIVTGWGFLAENGNIPDRLQQVTVHYVEPSVCKKIYPFMITDRMLCANVNGGGKDSCKGDSGGPMILNNELLGIVSWGFGCARKSFAGVYASVPNLHEWIENNAKANRIEFPFL